MIENRPGPLTRNFERLFFPQYFIFFDLIGNMPAIISWLQIFSGPSFNMFMMVCHYGLSIRCIKYLNCIPVDMKNLSDYFVLCTTTYNFTCIPKIETGEKRII